MAKSEVLRHDLTTTLLGASALNLDDSTEAIPFPVYGKSLLAAGKTLAKPPVTTLVSDEDRVKAPYRSVGKVGAVIAGKTMVASGWVVAKRAFITAGHCVYGSEHGGWITKAQFYPRYHLKAGKIYEVKTVYALRGWVDDAEAPYDMAACEVTEDFAETEPPLKFEITLLPPKKFIAIGYPRRLIGGHDFNGERMWQCVGDHIKAENNLWWAENNFTHGASGGPWCDSAQKSLASGLLGGRVGSDPNAAVSPDFWNGFNNLYKAVKDL